MLDKNAMKYIEATLGVQMKKSDAVLSNALPYFVTDGYQIDSYLLDGMNACFVTPLERVGVPVLKKHLAAIERSLKMPAVLVCKGMTSRQRKLLIESRIPFVADGLQLYLPFLGVMLQERFSQYVVSSDVLGGMAQAVVLYCILHHLMDFRIGDVAKALDCSAMSVSRAVKELEGKGLLTAENYGKAKSVSFVAEGMALFDLARPFLSSPVRKRIYIGKGLAAGLPRAGETALSDFSMIAPPTPMTFACNRLTPFKGQFTTELMDVDEQVCLEVWTYNPAVCASDGCVDRLSLMLSMEKDADERIESAVEQMMDAFWERYDG